MSLSRPGLPGKVGVRGCRALVKQLYLDTIFP
jgi:hypothetical protein